MDIELQGEPLGRGRGQPGQPPAAKSDENEAGGYGDTSTQIWKLYGRESENHDKALVDGWKGNTDSMLIFTGLFSAIVAAFLIETYKSLLPDNSSQTVSLLAQLVAQSNGTAVAQPQTPGGINPSAIRVNILMFLSLFFSMTSALISTLIQQWAREYLQYSQPSAAPHKRGRVRAYLFDGLSRFQMRRLINTVPVLLHVSVFLFFFALSDWLYSISNPVGATARYCLVVLFSVYMALSILPLIVENAPYQTALTTPLRACVSLIQVSYLALLQLLLRSSRVKGPGLFKSIHVDRSRALMKETKKRASKLDRSAMHWLQQELDEDDMDTFLSGLPGYFHSPLTDTKIIVEGLREDGVPGRIREHFTTCVTSMQLSEDEFISRALACIKSLRLISEVAAGTIVRPPGLEDDDMQTIMEYLAPLCHTSNTSTALRASCIRSLVIYGFLASLTHMDTEELRTREFPSHLTPLYRVIRVWKTTEIAQWSQLPISPPIDHPFPSDQEMWTDILCDGPLINLAVLANTVLSRARDEEIALDMAWKTLEILLKALGLAQVQASALARTRLDEVRAVVSNYEGGGPQITALLETLDIAIRGLRLVEVFACPPKRKLPPRRIEAIFGPEQLRNRELLDVFAARLPKYVVASTPEISKNFMERLILEDKLWEQLHVPLSKSFDPQVPFADRLRVVMAFISILDVAFAVSNDSSDIDWQSPDFDLLMGIVLGFEASFTTGMFVGKGVFFRLGIFHTQYCHTLLAQFSMGRSRGEPFFTSRALGGLSKLVTLLHVGTQEDRDYVTSKYGPEVVTRAEAILSLTIRDGPMSNFFRLGRTLFELLATDVPNSMSNDVEKAYALLRRIVDTRNLPLIDASEEMWSKFDDLQVAIHGAVALGGGGQNVNNIQRLLDIVDEVGRMRPAAHNHPEGTGEADDQTHNHASLDQPPPDPFPSPSSGSLNVTPPGPVNQDPVPAPWSDVYPTPDPQYEGDNPGSE